MKNIIVENLNKQQKAAVLYTKGPLAIIAGAGSGKTNTLTKKIAYLIKHIKIKPNKILAVTFTNKAANEMKERVFDLIGDKAYETTICTYHSFCAKILRKEIGFFNFPSNFNILDILDQKQILKTIYLNKKISPRTFSYINMLSFISKNKIQNITPEDLLEKAQNDTDRMLLAVYKEYQKQIFKLKSLDFDDLLIFVWRLFEQNKEIAQKWSNVYEYVLIDEFQDTSYIQYNIIKTLAGKNNITIVGDPDQTIYTWRMADINLIKNFKKYFKNTKIIKLEQNYRSTQNILNAANKLIQFNKGREDKKLFTKKEKGNIIEFFHSFSDEAESRWVSQKIQELKKNKTQLKEIAILYRSNYLSNTIEKTLIKKNINYVVFGGIKFYQRQEIKDAIAFLKAIDSGEQTSFLRIINVPSRHIGKITLDKLIDFADKKQLSLFETIKKYFKELPISLPQKNRLAIFFNLLGKYKLALKSNPINLVFNKFLNEVGYIQALSNNIEDVSRLENLKELLKSIKIWEENNKGLKLSNFLAEISLYTEDDQKYISNDYVSLMTVHASKGLEFDNVFIIGLSEGTFPASRSIMEGGDEALFEERRLAYVALTRARENVFLSDSRGYSSEYQNQKQPSRFIEEMGINIKSFTKQFIAPKKFEDNYSKNKNFIQGDRVSHDKFGEGVVLNVKEDLIEIVFKTPYGIKKLMKNHKSIERIS